MGISGMEREGEAALPRRDTILLVPVMRVSGGGGVPRCRSRIPAFDLWLLRSPSSISPRGGGWGKGGNGKKKTWS